MNRVDVIIGIVLRAGKILICQRLQQGPLGGFWEFPGGKQETGESREQCLSRELAEELAIRVRPIMALDVIEFDYADESVRLHPYLCEHLEGEPKPLASQRVLWVSPAHLKDYKFPPANDALIRKLIEQPGNRKPDL
jgi:A/G-specific adenine glycosylase